MAIDARAICSCSLGPLVSASISDDYIQGSGLIKVTGNCVIDDLITPDPGTIVTFTYTKKSTTGASITRTVPRKLRVLSSFADPYRRTTSVQLGCKLTYNSNLKEAYTWDAFDDPLNAEEDPADEAIVIIPISAASVAAECCLKLGIGGAPALSNKFSVATFDYSPGYVAVLSDLMVSECKYGYLDMNENLVVKSLNSSLGTVPVITNSQIIDISEINSGELPGESVVVNYNTLRLKDPEQDDENAASEGQWEYEETTGTMEYTTITAKGLNDEVLEYQYSNLPITKTYTTYDDWDRVISRIELQPEVRGAFLFSSYISEYLAFGASKNDQYQQVNARNIAGALFDLNTKTTITYVMPAVGTKPDEGYDEVYQEIVEKQEYNLSVHGACSVNYIDNQGNFDSQSIYPMTTEKTVTTYEKTTKYVEWDINNFYYAYQSSIPVNTSSYFTDVTKTVVQKTAAYGYTPLGQADISKRNDQGIEAPKSYSNILNMVDAGTETRITSGREVGLQSRPDSSTLVAATTSDNGDPNNGYSTPSMSQIELALGSVADTANRVEFTMPYAPDDIFIKIGVEPNQTYSSLKSDASSKANAFGRVQNELLLGNRYGMNIQTLPEYIPLNPFSGFVVEAAGYQVAYRVNGLTWTMDANGVIVSTDGLFRGGIGGTGNAWFPVAPGVVNLPTTLPTSNSAPVQYIGSLPNVNVG
jgi:hypothetical protein